MAEVGEVLAHLILDEKVYIERPRSTMIRGELCDRDRTIDRPAPELGCTDQGRLQQPVERFDRFNLRAGDRFLLSCNEVSVVGVTVQSHSRILNLDMGPRRGRDIHRGTSGE